MNQKVVKLLLFIFISLSINTTFAQDTISVKGVNFLLSHKYKIASVIAKADGYAGIVNIPKTVTVDYEPYPVRIIRTGAFSRCPNLKEVIIPSSVNEIQENAFTVVPKGLKIYINTSNTIAAPKGFDQSCYDNATVFLPTESILAVYKRTPYWNKFINTGIVPKAKSDGVDRRKEIDKLKSNPRFKTSSKSKTIKF